MFSTTVLMFNRDGLARSTISASDLKQREESKWWPTSLVLWE